MMGQFYKTSKKKKKKEEEEVIKVVKDYREDKIKNETCPPILALGEWDGRTC